MPINRTRRMRTGLQNTPQRPSAQPTRARSTFTAQPMSAKTSSLAQRSRPTKTPRISSGGSGMQRSASRRFNTGGLAAKSGLAGASIPLTDEQVMEEKMFKPEEVGKSKERKEEKMRGMGRTKSEEEKMMPIKKNMGGSIKKKPDGAVYEINGRRVTKEQYEQASKKTDKAYERAGEGMDSQKLDDSLEAFGKKARERNKLVPINKNMGGGVKKKPPGLYANIHAKKKRIAAGSGEKMRKVGSKGAPTKAAFIKSAKTAKKG